jgi:hypothetical protein
MLIDAFLPEYDAAERHQILIGATCERVYQAVRTLDLGQSRPVRWLFALRELPRLLAGNRGRNATRCTLDSLLDSGFILLGEDPPREILLGVVGKFWTLTGGLVRLDAKGFHRFNQPGFAKAAWNFSTAEGNRGETLLKTETRIFCLDAVARRQFRVYWFFVRPFSGWTRREALRWSKRAAEAAPTPP